MLRRAEGMPDDSDELPYGSSHAVCYGDSVYVCIGSCARGQQRFTRRLPPVLDGQVDQQAYADLMTALEMALRGKGVTNFPNPCPWCPPFSCLARLLLLPVYPCYSCHEWHARTHFEEAFVKTVQEWGPRFRPDSELRWRIVDEPAGSRVPGTPFHYAGGLLTLDDDPDALIRASPYPAGYNIIFDLGSSGNSLLMPTLYADEPLTPALDSVAGDVETRLIRLDGLFDRGVVSREEHARARESILEAL